jgi:hypothetical protein
MTTLKNAWVIVRSDFRGDRLKLLWALLFAIVFMGYMSALTGMIIDDVIGGTDGELLSDLLLASTIPMLGITFSRRTMKYLAEDSYTRMLAYMRTLPIPAAVILCKRKLHTLFSFTLNGTLYFGLIYALSANIRSELPIPAYLAFAFTWIGYGLMISGMYIFIEFMVSGKAYFWAMIIFMVLAMGAAGLVSLAGGNMLLASVAVSKEWGLLSPLMWGSLLLGTVSVQLFSRWTIYRLKSRDLV